MVNKKFDEKELAKKLSKEQYETLVNGGTEAPFSGELLNNKKKGMYVCPVCGAELFSSDSKYDSHTPGLIGWPSFSDVISSNAVELVDDNSLGMRRTEVVCKNCGSHLGHLFPDKDSPTGQHYCINSTSLNFKQE